MADEIVGKFELQVEQVDGYEFRVRFDKPQFQEVLLDEPPPLGQDRGPNAARMLAAAIGNCLSASLVFCLQKKGVKLDKLATSVSVELVRNAQRRLRIGKVAVQLHPAMVAGPELEACLGLFEEFCTVTQSVRAGLEVQVSVEPVAP